MYTHSLIFFNVGLFLDLCFPTWMLKLACRVLWNEFGGIFIRIVLKLGWFGDNHVFIILILHFHAHSFEISFHHIIPPLPLTIGVILLLPLSSSFLNDSCSGLTDIFFQDLQRQFFKNFQTWSSSSPISYLPLYFI